MNKIVIPCKTGVYSCDPKSGNIRVKRRRNPFSSRNTDQKAGIFYKDFRYVDLLDLMIDNLPFSGAVQRSAGYVEWSSSNALRKLIGAKNCDAIMEQIECDKESEIKLSIGFDIKHIYEIVFGRKRLYFNIQRKPLSINLKGNIISVGDGFRSMEILFTKKPDGIEREGNVVELYFKAKKLEIMYRFDKTQFIGFDDFLKGEMDRLNTFKRNFVKIDVPDAGIADCFNKAVEDIYLLQSEMEIKGKNYKILHAGAPKFRRIIGRDSIISLQCLSYTYPSYAKSILKALISSVGKKNDASTGEEPGKLVHDILYGKEYGKSPLYDTSDANALFLIALADYVRITGDSSIISDNEGDIESIINWIIKKIDSYGFVSSGRGAWLPETSWMDTDDRVDAEYRERGLLQSLIVDLRRMVKFRLRGGLAPRGTRFPFEMQVQAVKGLKEISRFLDNSYEKIADELENAIDEHYWNGKYYVDLLNRKYHWISAKTSNMLYVIMYNIGKHIDETHALLTSSEFMPKKKYGVRTRSCKDKDYDAKSYQRGGVWPFQSYELAEALMQHEDELGFNIVRGCAELRNNEGNYLYEVYNGDVPVPLAHTNELQAWSSARYIDSIVRGLFGIRNIKPDYLLLSPYIPNGWKQMKLMNYKCGAGTINLEIINEVDDKGEITLNIEHEGMGLLCDVSVRCRKMPKKVLLNESQIEYSYDEKGKIKVNNLKINSGNNSLKVRF